MKSSLKFTAFKANLFLIMLFISLSITSCASTQKERLEKIDALGESMHGKFSKFLGVSPQTNPQEEWHSRKRIVTQEATHKPRSPLIHGFIYDVAQADKFIFFYQGKDARSVRFSEALKKYVDETGMKVTAYTIDNRSLPAFPESVLASQEIIEKYFGSSNVDVKAPALFLAQYDSYATLISTGEISYLELISRMNKIAEERIAKNPRKY